MDVVILIGRILFAAIFVVGGIRHFSNSAVAIAYAEANGLRPGRLFVLGSGIWMLVGVTLVILGAWADLGALMLLVFLVPTTLMMHRFWKVTDPEKKALEQIQFNKDTSLAGAALILFGFLVAHGNHLGYTLTAPLFH